VLISSLRTTPIESPFHVLLVMRLSACRVEIADVTPNPNAAWVQQAGRNLTDLYDGFPKDNRYLLLDCATKFQSFRDVLERMDTKVAKALL
jgi:hypothetical protein